MKARSHNNASMENARRFKHRKKSSNKARTAQARSKANFGPHTIAHARNVRIINNVTHAQNVQKRVQTKQVNFEHRLRDEHQFLLNNRRQKSTNALADAIHQINCVLQNQTDKKQIKPSTL